MREITKFVLFVSVIFLVCVLLHIALYASGQKPNGFEFVVGYIIGSMGETWRNIRRW